MPESDFLSQFPRWFKTAADQKQFEHDLENEETFAMQPLAKTRWTNAVPQAVTTFYLPDKTLESGRAEDDIWVYSDKGERKAITEALEAIPFPCIRIVRDLTMPPEDNWKRIVTDVVVWSNGEYFTWASKDTGYPRDGSAPVSMYSPHNKWGARQRDIPQSYIDLINILADSSNRYEEKHVNRQTRRREGFAKGYREYIVIPNSKRVRNPNFLRRADVFRRHPRLHAVRGHLRKQHERHYQSGRVSIVSRSRVTAHARGGGPDRKGLFQVKEYITEEEHVRS